MAKLRLKAPQNLTIRICRRWPRSGKPSSIMGLRLPSQITSCHFRPQRDSTLLSRSRLRVFRCTHLTPGWFIRSMVSGVPQVRSTCLCSQTMCNKQSRNSRATRRVWTLAVALVFSQSSWMKILISRVPFFQSITKHRPLKPQGWTVKSLA